MKAIGEEYLGAGGRLTLTTFPGDFGSLRVSSCGVFCVWYEVSSWRDHLMVKEGYAKECRCKEKGGAGESEDGM